MLMIILVICGEILIKMVGTYYLPIMMPIEIS